MAEITIRLTGRARVEAETVELRGVPQQTEAAVQIKGVVEQVSIKGQGFFQGNESPPHQKG